MGRQTCGKNSNKVIAKQRFVQRALVAQGKEGLIFTEGVWAEIGRMEAVPGKWREGAAQQFNLPEPKHTVIWHSVQLDACGLNTAKEIMRARMGTV